MAFTLDPDRPLGAALRIAALDELDKALGRLRGADVTEDDIHDARKSGKKLRAWLRLLRPELDGLYAVLNALLRDAGRRLSGRRDAHVALQTLRRMRAGRRLTADQFRTLADALGSVHAAEPAGADTIGDARRLLKAAQIYLQAFEPATDVDSLARRLDEHRARCVRGLRQCRTTRRTDDLHDWRKRVKYYGYQCALVAPVLADAAQPVDTLKTLGETLGLHHDFDAFAQRLERCPANRVGELLKLRARQIAQQRMDALMERALAQGDRLFGTSGGD